MAERGGSGEGSSSSPGKKARKPYTITRPRERWCPEEHERFLDALLRFGRDWKKIEEHVRTKTAVQIRSHAQKYFLKVQRLGLAAGLPPPQHPSRRLALSRQQTSPADGTAVLHGQPQHYPTDMQNLDWAGSSGTSAWVSHGGAGSQTEPSASTHPGGSSFMGTPSFDDTGMDWTGTGSTGEASAIADAEDETIPLPLSPDDMHFTRVYRFIGDIFDPATPCRIEAHLQKLKDMDGITVKTILLVLRNLETNLTAPQFEPIKCLLLIIGNIRISLYNFALAFGKAPCLDMLCVEPSELDVLPCWLGKTPAHSGRSEAGWAWLLNGVYFSGHTLFAGQNKLWKFHLGPNEQWPRVL
ncbi:protein REVEILLE 4-like [Triticum dicoccoides]|uniref:protein REVEILLE 4-like n=1 Tax=Triticum dicoccoides TaxID=85692 RepID=UPI00188ECBD7|nr:protein REVEILLE 4-like [Triticum dicoccoides]